MVDKWLVAKCWIPSRSACAIDLQSSLVSLTCQTKKMRIFSKEVSRKVAFLERLTSLQTRLDLTWKKIGKHLLVTAPVIFFIKSSLVYTQKRKKGNNFLIVSKILNKLFHVLYPWHLYQFSFYLYAKLFFIISVFKRWERVLQWGKLFFYYTPEDRFQFVQKILQRINLITHKWPRIMTFRRKCFSLNCGHLSSVWFAGQMFYFFVLFFNKQIW